jgi:hypothetical protein
VLHRGGPLIENPEYQHAVNQLILTFFLIGRMSSGSYPLPIVAWAVGGLTLLELPTAADGSLGTRSDRVDALNFAILRGHCG